MAGIPEKLLQFHRQLVDVAPAPVFSRLERGDDRVLGCVKMLGGVLVLGIVATPDVPAGPA
jgi:hypothetical protein